MGGGGDVSKCEYCDGELLKQKEVISDYEDFTLIVGSITIVEYQGYTFDRSEDTFRFNYCPMCGRKLSDK